MLPVVTTIRGKYTAGVLTALISAAMYFAPPHWPLFVPVQLPMTALDKAIPFWPDSGLVYAAMFLFLLGTFIFLDRLTRVSQFLYACLFCQTVGMICFVFWPTTFPRELYPLAPSTDALGTALATYFRATDTPANCLPSLHVCTVVLCVGALRGGRLFIPGILAGVPLALSTLTFKQHYVADVVAGLALGLLACFLFFRASR
jgi:membrane-associated phospholipid phosphatase